jgi:hypothetical protein
MAKPGASGKQATEIKDEPGMAERFQRGLQRALNTPPKPRKSTGSNPKERPPRGKKHS